MSQWQNVAEDRSESQYQCGAKPGIRTHSSLIQTGGFGGGKATGHPNEPGREEAKSANQAGNMNSEIFMCLVCVTKHRRLSVWALL